MPIWLAQVGNASTARHTNINWYADDDGDDDDYPPRGSIRRIKEQTIIIARRDATEKQSESLSLRSI